MVNVEDKGLRRCCECDERWVLYEYLPVDIHEI